MSFLYRRAWEIKRPGKHDKWKDEGHHLHHRPTRRESTAPCQSACPTGPAVRKKPAAPHPNRMATSARELVRGPVSRADRGGHQRVDRIPHYGPAYCQVGRNPERGISSNTREETAPPPRGSSRGRPRPIPRGTRLRPACRRARTAASQLYRAGAGPPSCASSTPGGSRGGAVGGHGTAVGGRREPDLVETILGTEVGAL